MLGGLYISKIANSLYPNRVIDISITNQCVRVLQRYCHGRSFLFVGFDCEKHIYFFFVNKQSKVWTLQVVGKWSQRQETRLQRESGMGLLSHWTSEHQGASMTVREVSKRKAGLWTFQSLNVLSREGQPTREKYHDSLLCALLSQRKLQRVWVCVNTGVVAGVQFACGVRCARGSKRMGNRKRLNLNVKSYTDRNRVQREWGVPWN